MSAMPDDARPLRVALLIERFDPDAGGAERSTAQIAQELTRRGHAVTILAGSVPRQVDGPPGVAIRAMARRKSASAWRAVRLAAWARRELAAGDFDVSLSVTMALPAMLVQPRSGTVRSSLQQRVAMRGQGPGRRLKQLEQRLSLKYQALLALERRTVNDPQVKRFIPVSAMVGRELQQHYGIADQRVQVIANGSVMPVPEPEQMAHWRQQVRTAFSVPEQATAYLFPAQDPARKGFDTLLRAARQLLQRGQSPVLLLAGQFHYGHLRAVNAAGLGQAVRFVRHARQMPALYAAADVTVLPTWYDPASKVILESLMLGRPAISTRYNGASDWIAPADGGLRGRVIDEPDDDAALARAMQELAEPQNFQQCARACAGLHAALSMARHVDELERVFYAVAGDAPVDAPAATAAQTERSPSGAEGS